MSKKEFHYGIWVSSKIPITGVFNNSSIEFLGDELYDAVDLDFEEHCEECKNEDHDDCYQSDSSTMLIGFKKGDDGLYDPDPEAEYSAIIREIYAQVVNSKWIIECGLCSPCYPGQGNPDSPGKFLAYSFPPDVLGESFERVEDIKKFNKEI